MKTVKLGLIGLALITQLSAIDTGTYVCEIGHRNEMFETIVLSKSGKAHMTSVDTLGGKERKSVRADSKWKNKGNSAKIYENVGVKGVPFFNTSSAMTLTKTNSWATPYIYASPYGAKHVCRKIK